MTDVRGEGDEEFSINNFIAFPSAIVGHGVEISGCPAEGIGDHQVDR